MTEAGVIELGEEEGGVIDSLAIPDEVKIPLQPNPVDTEEKEPDDQNEQNIRYPQRIRRPNVRNADFAPQRASDVRARAFKANEPHDTEPVHIFALKSAIETLASNSDIPRSYNEVANREDSAM